MTITYLKKAVLSASEDNDETSKIVADLLSDIKAGGEQAVRELSEKYDGYSGEIVVSEQELSQAAEQISEKDKQHIDFAYNSIARFAQAQLASMSECVVELQPGYFVGQRNIPISSAGCYVPGGRYSHIASAIMTITTAKVAGVKHVTAVTPPRGNEGISPEMLYTMGLCGADRILKLGGVQGIGAMTYGLFGCQKANILVGPGNQFVAEAKRLLFGQVGIDMFAGPTDSMVVADSSADADLVAQDLVGQAEHGYNSPVWLVTDNEKLAQGVITRVAELIPQLPELNGKNAEAAWRDYGEVILCSDRDEMVKVADDYAPEHLQVQARDLDWWLENLSAYGSLFLGEETTVAFGDKSSGPNHVLPTSGAAKYTGGLSVHKFIKTVTWQRSSLKGMREVAEVTAHISRLEGMEGHARTADARLKKLTAVANS